LVTSKKENKPKQILKTSKEFPMEEIQKGWDEEYYITQLVKVDDLYYLVMIH
jgi:hypothetical protein